MRTVRPSVGPSIHIDTEMIATVIRINDRAASSALEQWSVRLSISFVAFSLHLIESLICGTLCLHLLTCKSYVIQKILKMCGFVSLFD